MNKCWWSGGIAPRILHLGTRWRWIVNFTPRPLYPVGKSPCYPLDRRLSGSQSRFGHGGEEKNSQPLPELEPPIIEPIISFKILNQWLQPTDRFTLQCLPGPNFVNEKRSPPSSFTVRALYLFRFQMQFLGFRNKEPKNIYEAQILGTSRQTSHWRLPSHKIKSRLQVKR